MLRRRPPAPYHDDPTRWRFGRVRQRRTVVLVVLLLAGLTTAQSFAEESRQVARVDEGGGRLVSSTAPVDLVGDAEEEPLVPPALPSGEQVDVGAPADQAQAEPSPRPTPRPEIAALDLSEVTAQLPKIKLREADGMVNDPVGQVLAVEGVTFATSVQIGELPIESDRGSVPVSVAAVDPNGFRVLTPQVTADAIEVWQRIAEGDAAFTHDIGTRHELELGSRIPAGDDEDSTLRVGAYASNGVPPIADAVVSRSTAAELGLESTTTVLVSLAEDVEPEQIAAALSEATGMESEVIAEPETRRAFLSGAAARDAFEPFSYISIGDGMIQIDREWVRRNIVSAPVPIFRGNVICHRLLIPQLRGALQEIVDRELDHLIDPTQYGGCWVPRHILFNPNRALSMHSWGIAVDFNVRGNEYGNSNPEMDPRIVEVFKRWGFTWGGDWSTPDGMHFELNSILDGSGR